MESAVPRTLSTSSEGEWHGPEGGASFPRDHRPCRSWGLRLGPLGIWGEGGCLSSSFLPDKHK